MRDVGVAIEGDCLGVGSQECRDVIDLATCLDALTNECGCLVREGSIGVKVNGGFLHTDLRAGIGHLTQPLKDRPQARRSEEHTSELQSLMRISYAVFCSKKKN